MAKVAIMAILFLFSLFMLAMPNTLPRVSAPPRPLCASQFNIVNYACGGLPLSPFSPPPSRRNTHSSSSSSHSSRSSHSRRSSSSRHRRRHRQRGEDRQDYCCQWLRQVDNECVCDVLAHLPPFLSRPNHHYTVTVGDTCTIRFPCGGRLVP